MSRKAIVRVFDLQLSYDTERPDNEIEYEVSQLLEKINVTLMSRFPKQAPALETSVTKPKIGITEDE